MTPLIPSRSIVQLASGKFKACWYVNRNRKQRSFSSYKRAEEFLVAKIYHREKEAIYGQSNDVLIEDLISQYKKEVKKSLNSNKRDSIIIPRFKNWLEDKKIKYVSQLNKGHIQEYELFRGRSGVCQRTINIDIRLLNAVLNHAWKHDRITHNPIARYPYKKDKLPFKRFLTFEEIKNILNAAKDRGMHDAVYTFLTLGLRSEELCFLRYSDITNNTIHFRSKMCIINGQKVEWRPKWNQERWVALDHDYANDPYLQKLLGKGKGFCFTDKDKKPFNRGQIYKRIKTILKHSGIDNYNDITTHTLRHTHISYMVARNVPIRTIMANVGINDFQTLLDYAQAVKGLSKNLPNSKKLPWQK